VMMMIMIVEALSPTYFVSSKLAFYSETNLISISDYCSPENSKGTAFLSACLIRSEEARTTKSHHNP